MELYKKECGSNVSKCTVDVETARQNCYSWKALLLKFINENTQGGRSEQNECKTCLAFLDFSNDKSKKVEQCLV